MSNINFDSQPTTQTSKPTYKVQNTDTQMENITDFISDEYRALTTQLHKQSDHFGSSAYRCWGEQVHAFINKWADNANSILDYGCGKQTISKNIPNVTDYDPSIAGLDGDPPARDLLLCIDVLEHIEPEKIDSVIEHIASKTNVAAFFVVSVRPACAKLPDGRNAHILIKPWEWWKDKISQYMVIDEIVAEKENDHIAFTAIKKNG